MEFNKPGPNKRVCAFVIDSIVGWILGIVFSFILARNVSFIIWTAVILFKDCFSGQSFGKFLVGTQIVDENNYPASALKVIIRNIFMAIPIFPIIEYVVMLRDKEEGKRIGDRVGKTKVTDLKPEVKDSLFLWISIVLVLIVMVIQTYIGLMLIKQHPELLQKPN